MQFGCIFLRYSYITLYGVHIHITEIKRGRARESIKKFLTYSTFVFKQGGRTELAVASIAGAWSIDRDV